MGQLEQIGFAAGTDKSSIEHGFLDFYEASFKDLRGDSFTLLEIGVLFGQSLKTWADYSSKATVVGIDIADRDLKVKLPSNAHRRFGDASRLEVLDEVVREFGAPRIVVDDGSHLWHHQIETLRYLWPRVLPGGAFVMEDIHTSFPAFGARYQGSSRISAFDYLQELQKWVSGGKFMTSPEGMPEIPYDGFVANYWQTIRSMHFFHGTCILHKTG